MTKILDCCALTAKIVGKTWFRVCCPCLVSSVLSDYLDDAMQVLGAEKPLNSQSQGSTWSRYWQSEAATHTHVREDALQFYECTMHVVGRRFGETRCLHRGRILITYNYVCFMPDRPGASPNLVARWDGINGLCLVDWYGNAQSLRLLDQDHQMMSGVFVRLNFLDGHYWTLGDFADTAAAIMFLSQLKRIRDATWAPPLSALQKPSFVSQLSRRLFKQLNPFFASQKQSIDGC